MSEGEEGYLGISGGLVSLEKGTPHVVGGEEVKFRIVEPGVWGQYEDINRFVETEQVLSPKDLYQVLNHGKKHSGGGCMYAGSIRIAALLIRAGRELWVGGAHGRRSR